MDKWFKTDKNRLIETISLEYILCMGLFSGYLQHLSEWRTWLLRIGMILVFLSPKPYELVKKYWKICILMVISVAFFYLSAEVKEDFTNLNANFRDVFYTFFIVLIVFVVFHSEVGYVWKTLKRNFLLLNGWFIANLIVISIQVRGIPLFIKPEWLDINPYYADQCSGLFGPSGTHRLALFSIFILLYNLQFAKEITGKKLRVVLMVYTYLSSAYMMFLSTKNENTFIFVLYVVALLVFYYTRIRHMRISLKQFVLILIPILVFCVVILLLIPSVSGFLRKYLIRRLATSANVFAYKDSVQMVNERVRMVAVALQSKGTYLAGAGLGGNRWSGAGLFGFIHFGMNSISSFVTLGGIWFYCIISALFTLALYYIKKSHKRNWSRFIVLIVVMQILAVYTTVFTTNVLIIWVVLCVIAVTQTAELFDSESVVSQQREKSIGLRISNRIRSMNKQQWKKALLIGVVGGIVFGGVRIVRGIALWDTQQLAYEQSYQDYLKAVPEFERQLDSIDFEIGIIEENYQLGQLSEDDYKTQMEKKQLERRVFVRTKPEVPQNQPTIKHSIYRIVVFAVLGFLCFLYSAVLFELDKYIEMVYKILRRMN